MKNTCHEVSAISIAIYEAEVKCQLKLIGVWKVKKFYLHGKHISTLSPF